VEEQRVLVAQALQGKEILEGLELAEVIILAEEVEVKALQEQTVVAGKGGQAA
jgi:hypothetical protein